ncbi:MAG: DUF5009 domain-containing protein [Marinilabiliales bacterium]|nr:DUF5009 domain-containing protein [Marinilabiliales bacterium]
MENNTPAEKRILSVDVLRGFDMFWLVGGTGIALALVKLAGGWVQDLFLPQLDHAEWIGFTFYDLIFPLFEFVMGMSLVFSLSKILRNDGKMAAYKRLLRRFLLLYLLGFIYYGGFSNSWPDIRLLGVLQRLAFTYLFAGMLYIHLEIKWLALVSILILIGNWILFCFVPVPDTGMVSLTPESNWAQYVDVQFLPGKKNGPKGMWDILGILGTLPATVSCLLGVFAAKILRNDKWVENQRVKYLLMGGLALIVVGLLWSFHFPIIKKIWSSTYVLIGGGLSLLLMGLFYYLIDVKGYRKWTPMFVWIGVNPITIYMARNLIDFGGISKKLAGGNVAGLLSEPWAYLLLTSVSMALSLVIVWFLYNRKIFIKV